MHSVTKCPLAGHLPRRVVTENLNSLCYDFLFYLDEMYGITLAISVSQKSLCCETWKILNDELVSTD